MPTPTVDIETDNLLVAITAQLNVAPSGTPLPATAAESLDAAFVNVGATDEKGFGFNSKQEMKGLYCHQRKGKVRSVPGERTASIDVVLNEINSNTLITAFGGGSVADGIYSLPANGSTDELAVVLDIFDGDRHVRVCMEKATASPDVKTQFDPQALTGLAVNLEAIAGDGDSEFIIIDDDFTDAGTAPVSANEVQVVTVTGTGGTYTLTFKGATTSSLAFDAASSAVQTAVRALSTVGATGASVSGSSGGPYTITFGGPLANTNVPKITATSSLTGPSAGVAITTSTSGHA